MLLPGVTEEKAFFYNYQARLLPVLLIPPCSAPACRRLLPIGHVRYFTLTTASGHRLQLSSSHYAYTAPSPSSTWSQRIAVEGKAIQPGHMLWVVDSETGSLVQSEVTDVKIRAEAGAFVVWTLEGHAVVEGTAPSSYSSSFGSDEAMHKVRGAAAPGCLA